MRKISTKSKVLSAALAVMMLWNTDCRIPFQAYDMVTVNQSSAALLLPTAVRVQADETTPAATTTTTSATKTTTTTTSTTTTTTTTVNESTDWTYQKVSGGIQIVKYKKYDAELTVPAVIDGLPVVEIAANAFKSNSYIKKVTLPDTVTAIGEYAFYSCSKLQSVNFPSSLETIGYYAFSANSSIVYPELPKTVKFIDSYAFYNIGRMESYVVPQDCTCGSYIFMQQNALKEITLDPSMRLLPYMFRSCKLSTVTLTGDINDYQLEIGMFYNCTSLTKFNYEGNWKNIPNDFFYSCSALSMEVPKTLFTVGSYAFYSCSKLTGNLRFAANAEVNAYAFYRCGNLSNISFGGAPAILGDSCFEYTYFKTFDFMMPTKLCGDNIMAYNTSLKQATIPENLTEIPNGLFRGCSYLQEINLSEHITKFGDYAFTGCRNIPHINIDEKIVTYIGDGALSGIDQFDTLHFEKLEYLGKGAFSDCKQLKEITFQPSCPIDSIGSNTFQNCESLTAIELPYGVTSIGDYAFSGCKNLKNVTIRGKLKEIGMYAFQKSGIESFEMPNTVESVGYSTFAYCESLQTVTISPLLTAFPNGLFQNCKSLQNMTIPASVRTLGSSVFEGCSSLTELTIPESVVSIQSGLCKNCTYLTDLTLSSHIKSIPASMCENCVFLESIEIPQAVSGSFGTSAFAGCTALKSINIPEGVTDINSTAFAGCTALKSVLLPTSIQKVFTDAFKDCICSITVPTKYSALNDSSIPMTCPMLYVYQESPSETYALRAGIPYTLIEEEAEPTSTTPEKEILTDAETGLKYYLSGSSAYIVGCDDSVVDLVIPEKLGEEQYWVNLTDYSLRGCKFKTVHIETGNTQYFYLPAYCFMMCQNLEKVTFSDEETSISCGDCLFSNCTALKEVDLHRFTYLSKGMFENCKSLKKIENLNPNLTSLSEGVFLGCDSLELVDCSNCCSDNGYRFYINSYAFQNLKGLKKVILPASISTIPSHCFENDTALETVAFFNPDNLNLNFDVQSSAFENCSSLKDADFLSGCNYINDCAFKGCSSLTSVTLPLKLSYAVSRSFEGCTSLKSFSAPGLGYLYEDVFKNCSSLENVDVPNATSMDDSAFAGCSSLKEITFPAMTYVSQFGFKNCTELEKVTFLTESSVYISKWGFSYCPNLTEVNAPNCSSFQLSSESFGYNADQVTVTEINDDGSTHIYTDYPHTLTGNTVTIHARFRNIVGTDLPVEPYLIYEPVGLEYHIADDAYVVVDAVTDPLVTKIPDMIEGKPVKVIGTGKPLCAEMGHDPLHLPDTVEEIGAYAFYGSGFIGDLPNLKTLGYHALCGSSNETEARQSHGTVIIGATLYCCFTTQLSYEIPENVTEIAADAFRGCRNLRTIVIPENVKVIGDGAFMDCTSLKTVSISDAAEVLGSYVFNGCTALESVALGGGLTSIGDEIFHGCEALKTVTAPKGSLGETYTKN